MRDCLFNVLQKTEAVTITDWKCEMNRQENTLRLKRYNSKLTTNLFLADDLQ